MMEFLVVFLAIIAAVQGDAWTPKTGKETKAIHEQCITKYKVSEEDIAIMKRMEYPDKKLVKKYIRCCLVNMELFSVQDGFYTDRWVTQFKGDLPAAEVKPIFDACFAVETCPTNAWVCCGRNRCCLPNDDWVFYSHRCFMKSKVGKKQKEYLNSAIYS